MAPVCQEGSATSHMAKWPLEKSHLTHRTRLSSQQTRAGLGVWASPHLFRASGEDGRRPTAALSGPPFLSAASVSAASLEQDRDGMGALVAVTDGRGRADRSGGASAAAAQVCKSRCERGEPGLGGAGAEKEAGPAGGGHAWEDGETEGGPRAGGSPASPAFPLPHLYPPSSMFWQ